MMRLVNLGKSAGYYRKRKRSDLQWLQVCVFVMLSGLITFAGDLEKFGGKIDLGGNLIYVSEGKIVRRNGRVTKTSRFFNEKNQLILSESVTFTENDFKIEVLEVNEIQHRKKHEIIREGAKYLVKSQKEPGEKYDERTVNDQPLILHGSYLPIYLSQHLDRIGPDGHICHLIIIPRKMEIEMIFRQAGTKIVNGHKCYEITMDAANIFFKPLVKTHYFYFGVEDSHRLYFYIGTIAPTGPDGDSLWGKISFTYS